MSENEIKKKRTIFARLISLGRLNDAIVMLRSLAENALAWEISDEVNRIDSAYSYLLRYVIEGVDDPKRREIYDSMVDSLLTAYDRLERTIRIKDDPAAYFAAARMRRNITLQRAVADYRRTLNDITKEPVLTTPAASTAEAYEKELFDAIWLTFPFSGDDIEALKQLLEHKNGVPTHVKRLIISALMLGSLQYFDPRRLALMADIYESRASTRLGIVALIALLLSLYMTRRHRRPTWLRLRLEALRDIPSWKSDIKIAFLELIRTRDTDRITRKLTDEIVPKMLKMKPDIERAMSQVKPEEMDLSEMEENPVWQNMLEQSGISDTLRELSEIQEEGGDVMMGTFAHLKSFPFFQSVSNWFLPFHRNHSSVLALGEEFSKIAEMIAGSAFMCDSDKYSFLLAIGSMPKEQRELMVSQLGQQNQQHEEIRAAGLDTGVDRRANDANKYVQNLYRFFRLFSRRADFADPFESAINLAEVPLLAGEFIGDSTMLLVAEFYFKHQYYAEALDLFKLIEREGEPGDQLYQKMGYCLEKLGKLPEAINAYSTAELFNGNDPWLQRRLAWCYRHTGNYTKSLEYYRQLESTTPDNASFATNIGENLLKLGRYADAVKAFSKAEYLKPSPRASRRLARALLLNRDFDRASEILSRLLDTDEASADDLLYAGHIAAARSDFISAVDYYSRSISAAGGNFTLFINAMRGDGAALNTIGIPAEVIPLLIDAVAYRRQGRL